MNKHITKIGKTALVVTLMTTILTQGSSFINNVNAQTSQIADEFTSLSLLSSGDFEKTNSVWQTKEDYKNHIVSENGNRFGRLRKGVTDGFVLQYANVKPGRKYRLTADVRLTYNGDPSTLDGAFLTVKNSSYSTKKTVETNRGQIAEKKLQYTDGNWHKETLEFTANDQYDVSVGILKWTETNAVGRDTVVDIDNVTLVQIDNGAEYNYVWEDDFTGQELNQDIWGYELGRIRGNEQQHYTDSQDNVFIKDGNLVLKVTDRKTEDQYINPRGNRKVIYNSGSVRTHGKKEFLYGRIEMKAKLPKGQGVFPAFWTLGSDFVLDGDINSQQGYGWARCGEIDIMELIGQAGDNSYGNRTVYQTAHTDNNRVTETKLAGTAYTIGENFNNEYHVFGIDWSPNKIEWYVDDEIVQSVDYSHLPIAQKALNRPQYIQMNLAMGGNWPGDVGTGLAGTEFDIDYVYYGQNASQKAAAKAYYETAPHMTGLQNITMVEGEIPDLLKNISVTEGYHVDFSIDDEYMFQSHGGRTECSLRCKGKDDAATLATLPAGKYNIHYTAIPDEVEFETDQWDSSLLVPLAEKEYKFDRKTMILTIVKAE